MPAPRSPTPPAAATPHVTWHAHHHAGPFRITHKAYDAAFAQTWHEHDEASIDFVLAGSGAGIYHRKEVVSHAGTVEFFAAGVRHRFASHRYGIRTLHIVMSAELPRQIGIDADILVRALDASAALRPAAALLSEVTHSPAPDPLLLESLGLALLHELLPPTRPDDGAWIADLRAMLLDQPELATSLRDIANRVGLHPSHIARHFRLATGLTVGEFGRRVRLARAARHLASRSAPPIVAIAQAQGFADQAHFTRAFRAAYGCTPLAFRKTLGLTPDN